MNGVNPSGSLLEWVVGPFGGRGRVALIARDERSGREVAVARRDEAFESASIIKLAILAFLLEEARSGRASLAEPLAVAEEDRAPGDGIVREWALPLALPARDVAVAMIVLSDNTATNTLLRRLGVDALNAALEHWGFRVTRSRGAVRPRPAGAPGIGVTSAAEVVELLDGLRSGRFGTLDESAWAMQVLERQQDDRAMSRYLAPGARCAHKTGTAETVRHDAGLLLSSTGEPLLTACFLTEEVGPSVERHDHPAVLAIGRAVVRLVIELGLPVPLVPWAPVD